MTNARARAGVCLALTVAVAGIAARAGADQVVITSDRDTTVFQEGALANGAGQHFFTGRTDQPEIRRALVRFDVAAAIPPGSKVIGVSLSLYCSRTKSQNENISLHRVLSSWGEGSSDATQEEGQGAPATTGDATWLHRFHPASPWTKPGGDFASVASASSVVGGQNKSYVWSSNALIGDVQSFLDQPAQNFGWIVVGNETGQKVTKRFDSREYPEAARRPRLTIDYTPPAAQTGACCAADGSCTSVLHPGSSCGGSYQGAGSTCGPNQCPQPTGACCAPTATASCSVVTSAVCASQGGTFQGALSACAPNPCPVVLTPYLDAVPRPPPAAPVSGVTGGAATYELAMVELSQKLHAQLAATRVWGFDDGSNAAGYPGPTIETFAGKPIQVTWKNDLRDASGVLRTKHYLPVDTCLHGALDASPRTVIHLHGGHVPAASDGYPEATFLPGQHVIYDYPNAQNAATLWYHDHAIGITRLNVYMGLAGFYIVRSAAEQALGLPSGEYEVPLVIQDRSFHADGRLKYPNTWSEHFFGDKLLVNGKVWPYLEVARGKYRLRVLNGSNARTYTLSLSNGAPLWQIGTDGGLLEAPVQLQQLTLTPGERADLVVDFATAAAGSHIVLQNSASAPFPDASGVGVIPNVMQFRVTSASGHTAALPSTLDDIVPLSPTDAVATRDFTLDKQADPCGGSSWRINGLDWMTITEKPKLGTSEVWRFVNTSGAMHPMHMHLVFFQVLDRQAFDLVGTSIVPKGSPVPPPAHEAGFKDTVQVAPKEIVRVIARFTDYVGKYPYHCHILEHEDHEMMRQFETTTTCGDGALGMPVEICDDGNTIDGDGCDNDCTPTGCGNGIVTGGETCDPPSTCPSSCDDGDPCTNDLVTGNAAACTAACQYLPIAGCGDAGPIDGGAGQAGAAGLDGGGGLADSGVGGGAGAGGGSGIGGVGGGGLGGGGLGGGGALDGGGDAGASTSDPGDDGGCGCRTPKRGAPAGAWLALLSLLALGRRRRCH